MADTYFFTDVHGHLIMYNTIINWIKNKDKDANIIYGGDACDHGDYGYEIMYQLLNDPNIIYLKGNHEDLFVKAARQILKSIIKPHVPNDIAAFIVDRLTDDVQLHIYNGGAPTLIKWIQDSMPIEILEKLNKLPLIYQYNNFDFSHAGGNPKVFNEVINKNYSTINESCMLWDRSNFSLGWINNRCIVHGHTPTTSLPARFYGSKDKNDKTIHPAIWKGIDYKDKYSGYRIDMDTGVIWSDRAYVLNCTKKIITGFTGKEKPEIFEEYEFNLAE